MSPLASLDLGALPLPLDPLQQRHYSLLSIFGAPPVPLDTAASPPRFLQDLPDASFAGQQETYLNVMGYEDWVTATSFLAERVLSLSRTPME